MRSMVPRQGRGHPPASPLLLLIGVVAIVLLATMLVAGVPPIPLLAVGSIFLCVGFHLALDPRDPTGEGLIATARRGGKRS
jgi:hypothetical protein